MLQDGLRLVLFDGLWHHVQDIVHDSRTQFQVVVGLHSLLCYRLGHAFTISAFELTCKQIT